MRNYAVVLLEQGDAEAAVPLLRESLTGFENLLGADHSSPGIVRKDLGSALLAMGEFAAAETELLEVHRVYDVAAGVTEGQKAALAESLVELYEAWEAAVPGEGHGEKAEDWRSR